jgi:hypothetical protein
MLRPWAGGPLPSSTLRASVQALNLSSFAESGDQMGWGLSELVGRPFVLLIGTPVNVISRIAGSLHIPSLDLATLTGATGSTPCHDAQEADPLGRLQRPPDPKIPSVLPHSSPVIPREFSILSLASSTPWRAEKCSTL